MISTWSFRQTPTQLCGTRWGSNHRWPLLELVNEGSNSSVATVMAQVKQSEGMMVSLGYLTLAKIMQEISTEFYLPQEYREVESAGTSYHPVPLYAR